MDWVIIRTLNYTDNFDLTWHSCNSAKIFNFSNEPAGTKFFIMKKIVNVFFLFLSTGLFAQIPADTLLNSLKRQFNLTEFDRPTEYIQFNKDTILIAGYLEDISSPIPRYEQQINVIYKTTNGGKNWRVVKFKGDAWIYDSYHQKDGKIWMGGSDNIIHHSDDFGETWERRIEPFNPTDRVLSIFMVDSLFGVAGGLSNGLAITHDNWNSSIQIETPIDQKKFQILKESARNRIDNIAIIDSLILINQNDYIFYSKLENINWKKFNIPVLNFNINNISNEIDLQSRNDKHFVIGSDLKFRRTYQDSIILWEPIRKDTTHIHLSDFLSSPLKSIIITSTKYEIDNQVHMTTIYHENTQIANIHQKDKKFYFKSNGYKKRSIDFDQDDIVSLFSVPYHIQLNELSRHLIFSELDFENYELIIKREQEKRKEQEKWGGNFTSQISLESPLFKEANIITSQINQDYLNVIYNKYYFPFPFQEEKNCITAIFRNKNNEEIMITNTHSLLYSLPWSITYKGVTINSYNPKLNIFFKSLLPIDFNNYEILLGGQLIYDLVEEKIIDELKYENDY